MAKAEGTPPIIAVANLKGGVGKSTTALMLAEGLAYRHGLKVLALDFDAQANLSELMLTSEGVQRDMNQERGICAVLQRFLPGAPASVDDTDSRTVNTIGATVIEELVTQRDKALPGGWVSLLPAHPNLRFLEPHLERNPGQAWFDVGDRLVEAVLSATADARASQDVVIIDCPPHVSALCRAALKMADVFVTPTLADPLSIWGVQQFVKWMLHPNMRGWLGLDTASLIERQMVVCTRFEARSKTQRSAYADMLAAWSNVTIAPPVRHRARLGAELPRPDLDETVRWGNRYRGNVRRDVEALSDVVFRFAGLGEAREGAIVAA